MYATDREVEIDIRNDPVLQWVREGIIGREAILPTLWVVVESDILIKPLRVFLLRQ